MSFLKVTALSLLSTAALTLYLYPNLRSFTALRSLIQTTFSRNSVAYHGPLFGLKISLILASFYAAQGFSSIFNFRFSKQRRSYSSSFITRIPFHFMEIPLLLCLIVFGSVLIPVGCIQKYTIFLAGFAPATPVLEVVALMTVVMAAGRSWTPQIIESNNFIKFLVILGCFASFFASSSIFYFIYAHFRLSTLIASLLSSIFTLITVQIISCCQLDHSTITDPALIFPYISYNLILITLKSGIKALLDHQRDPPIYPKNPQIFLKFAHFLFSTQTSPPPLTRQILQTIFSPVLIFHLLLQLALLTVVADYETEVEDGASFLLKARNYFATNIWPLFGKSFLVIVYTISWLEQCHPEALNFDNSKEIPFYLDSTGFWRWISIGAAIAWYSKHLLLDGFPKSNKSTTHSSYTCDKTFWKQFHNLKD